MNPENVGQQIPLRHSALWRKPLLYQKPQQQLPICHLQLNELGLSGRLWRTRNNPIDNTITFQRKLNKSTKHEKQKQKESTSTKQLDSEAKRRGIKLSQSMKTIKPGNSFVLAAYPGVGRYPWVIYDYHSWISNPNYNRNIKGKHFTS